MRIGELSAATGVTTKALRFYESAGLLPEPARTPSGYRDYDARAVQRVDFVRRGRAAGLTLAQIRGVLEIRDTGTAPCDHVREALRAHLTAIEEQIARLAALRCSVAELHARDVDPSTCDRDSLCSYL